MLGELADVHSGFTELEVTPRESNNHLPISNVRRCGAVVQILEEVSK